MVPIMIPILMFKESTRTIDKNPLHDGKRRLTGKKKIAMSPRHNFAEIKATSKALKVTINELMTSALSVAIKQLFEDRGDTKTDRMQIAVPVNIRWAPYKTYDEVQLENKFAPMPVKIPLDTDLEQALKKMKPVAGKMRRDFKVTYAAYILASLMGVLIPAWLCKIAGDNLSKPLTLSFSNIPGILRPIRYKDT